MLIASSKSSASLEMIKEEPLSEEDLRALQKDRQKKDNHNMSKYRRLEGPYSRTDKRRTTTIWVSIEDKKGPTVEQAEEGQPQYK